MREVDQFINYMSSVKGASEGTLQVYEEELTRFLSFVEKPVTMIDIDDAYEYLNYCVREKHNSPATRARKVSTIKSFFTWLERKKGVHNNVKDLEKPKVDRTLPKYLTLDESIKLLDTAKQSSKNSERNYCIITLFLNCGMRLNELSNIKMEDIRDNSTLIVYGKGGKERTVYLNPICLSALQNYLNIRNSESEYLFVTADGSRLSRRGVQEMVKTTLKSCGLEEYSTHKLRHTAATMYYQYCNADILSLKEMLGHSSVSTTQIYTHLFDSTLQEITNNSPLNNLLDIA